MRKRKNRRMLIGVVGIVGLVAAAAFAFPTGLTFYDEFADASIAGGQYSANWRDDNNATGEQGWQANLQASGPMRVTTAHVVIAPGGQTDWHYHSGLVLVSIVSGALTFYRADDPTCTPTVFSAGQGFAVSGSQNGNGRNEGTVPLDYYITYITPPEGPLNVWPFPEGTKLCPSRGF